eukprot:scaffold6509_cov109-Skeletonema_marinoi.AAC.1
MDLKMILSNVASSTYKYPYRVTYLSSHVISLLCLHIHVSICFENSFHLSTTPNNININTIMGAAISSSATAAAESLADDLHLENNTSVTAASATNNEDASPLPAAATAAATTTSNTPTRRSS